MSSSFLEFAASKFGLQLFSTSRVLQSNCTDLTCSTSCVVNCQCGSSSQCENVVLLVFVIVFAVVIFVGCCAFGGYWYYRKTQKAKGSADLIPTFNTFGNKSQISEYPLQNLKPNYVDPYRDIDTTIVPQNNYPEREYRNSRKDIYTDAPNYPNPRFEPTYMSRSSRQPNVYSDDEDFGRNSYDKYGSYSQRPPVIIRKYEEDRI